MLIGEFVKNVSGHLLSVAVGKEDKLLLRRGRRQQPWVMIVNPELWDEAEKALLEKRAREGIAA